MVGGSPTYSTGDHGFLVVALSTDTLALIRATREEQFCFTPSRRPVLLLPPLTIVMTYTYTVRVPFDSQCTKIYGGQFVDNIVTNNLSVPTIESSQQGRAVSKLTQSRY